MRGRFVTFEGPEGSGKSTQLRRLVEWLRAGGLEVVTVREPGGTRTGEMIRNILQHDASGEPIHAETEVFLFEASRAQLVRSVILPALERGAWVVSDRFADSTTVYQGYGRGLAVEDLVAMHRLAVGAAQPDLTLLLDLPAEEGLRRIRERSAAQGGTLDRIESENEAFHHRVRDGYLRIAARWPERIVVVPATGAMDVTQDRIRRIVNDRFGHVGGAV